MELQSVSRLSGGPPPSRSPARSFESPVRGWQRRPSGGNHGGGGGGHNQSGDALDTTLELDSSDIYGHFEQFGAKALSTLARAAGAVGAQRRGDARRGPARAARRAAPARVGGLRAARARGLEHALLLALPRALVKGVSGEAGRPPPGRLAGYVAARVAVTLVAVELTRRVSPIAAGSGIPETKSVLAGFSLPGFLTLRTLVAKVGGVVLLLGAGLPVGKEGPFIHTAAIFAEQLLSLSYFRVLNDTPEFRHQMLSAAAAVGVSAAFGAPIGGIMFSIEATATFYVTAHSSVPETTSGMDPHYWGAFFAATCGAFVSRELGYDDYAAFSPNFKKLPYKHWEMPLFFLLAAFGGLLGGLYVKLFTAIVGARRSCAEARDREPAGGAAAAARGAVEVCVGSNLGFGAAAGCRASRRASATSCTWARARSSTTSSATARSRARNGHIHERSKWEDQGGGVVARVCRALHVRVLRGVRGPARVERPPGGYAIVGAAAFSVSVTGKISIGVVICELTGQLSYAIPVLFAPEAPMGALSDAPWKLMVADVLFFMAFGMSSVLVPLLIVSRERRRCPDDDGDPCGAVAAQRIVAYGLCGGVPQALAGAWLGGVADARGQRDGCAPPAPAPERRRRRADGGYAALAPDDVAGPASATRTFSAAATRGFRAVAASLTASLAPAAGGWAADAYGDAPALAAAAALAGLALVWVVAALPPAALPAAAPRTARRWSKAQVGAYVSLLGAAAAVGNVALEPLARRAAVKRRDDRDVAVDLLLARLGCLASALLSLGFATVKTQRAMPRPGSPRPPGSARPTRRSRPRTGGRALYATVATALAALAILLARPPRPGVEPDLAEATLA
ncbi:voltage-gated chloride channel [Aureococcus anophagefferens]|nr:voltage-gated chloride channel [Aureococcus anophagefferens]